MDAKYIPQNPPFKLAETTELMMNLDGPDIDLQVLIKIRLNQSEDKSWLKIEEEDDDDYEQKIVYARSNKSTVAKTPQKEL